ncbi:MAG: hypothetical protein D6812_16400 [Deltaproteobacteria bacterium]|nr:MAG: hypothetical protein D6812_16400 [Deltaproteobacteria bacterium]
MWYASCKMKRRGSLPSHVSPLPTSCEPARSRRKAMSFDLRRYIFLLHLAFTGLCAFLTAGIVDTVVVARLEDDPIASPVQTRRPLGGTRLGSRKKRIEAYQVIEERFLFDAAHHPEPESPTQPDTEAVEETDLNVRLIGTIAGSAEDSLAIIQEKGNNKVHILRIGEKLLDVATVVLIEPRRVLLERHGKTEELLMLADKEKNLARRGRKPSRSSARGRMVAEGIYQVSQNDFEIEEGVVQEALSDLGSILRDARVVPHLTDGQIDGFKIFNIKPNSLFRKIGLKNGDILKSVNGMEIDSPERALELFEEFKNATNISLEVDRRGSSETLNYSIR